MNMFRKDSKLEEKIKKLEEEITLLKEQKYNVEPFKWLNHRVGQIERRLDRSLNDDWQGDILNS